MQNRINAKKLSAITLIIPAIAFVLCGIKPSAVQAEFDPFAVKDPNATSITDSNTNEGPVIPEVQFNNSDISMAFQIISDSTGWSIFPTNEVSKYKVSLWAKNTSAKQLLDTIVKTAGFIYAREGNVITVMTYDEYGRFYGLAKKIITLKYADPETITNTVKPFLTNQGKCVVHSKTNSLVVYDVEANLAIITEIIDKLDCPFDQVVVEVVSVKYADAEILADTLQKLFSEKQTSQKSSAPTSPESPQEQKGEPQSQPSSGGGSGILTTQNSVEVCSVGRTNQLIVKGGKGDVEKIKKLIEKLDTYTDSVTKNYRFVYVNASEVQKGLSQVFSSYEGGSSGQQGRQSSRTVGITLLESSNSIVLTGPPSAHRIMASIAESADTPSALEGGIIRIYKLENADVEEVADTIKSLFESSDEKKSGVDQARFQGGAGGRGERMGQSGAPQSTQSQRASRSQQGQSSAQEAESALQKQAKVATSKSTNSVIVQASPQQHQEIEKLIAQLDTRRKQVLIEAKIMEVTTTDNFGLGVELDQFQTDNLAFTSFGLSKVDPSAGTREIIVSPGGTAAVLKPGQLRAIIQAVQSNSNVKITSAPQILVNDNCVGTISSIAEEPITSINASTTVATTSFAGFVEAGTQFSITPHISEKDYLRVEYQIILNSFGKRSADSSIPPPRSTSSIQSEATVPDSSTIVVGGLQKADKTETVDKVPLLGDIPLLGYLFKNTTTQQQYKTTYLFITTTIMKNTDFADLKDASKQAMQKIQKDGAISAEKSEK